jgi:ribose transport system permease protein
VTIRQEIAEAPGGLRAGLTALTSSQRALRIAQGQGLLAILVGLGVAFTISSPYFFNRNNFLNIAGLVAILGIMAIAETLLVIAGGIDISVGSVVATCSVTLGLLDSDGVNIWVGVVLVLLLGAGIGLLNGFIVVGVGVDSLVTTLGTYSIFLGLAYVLSGTKTLIISNSHFSFLGAGEVATLPFPFIVFIALLIVGLFVERFTRIGRSIYAIGGNAEAARNAGIRVDAIRLWLYILTGLSAGIAGVLVTSELSSSAADVGNSYLLSVITAVILGGASLQGGRGSLVGTLIAVLILGVLQNGFALLQWSSFAQSIALGVFLIIAVTFDRRLRELENRRVGARRAERASEAPAGEADPI